MSGKSVPKAQKSSEFIVFFGEDANDRDALRILLFAMIRNPGRYKAKPLRKPIALVKDIDAAKRRARGSAVARAVRAINVLGKVRATIFHEDADAPEPAHVERERAILTVYSDLGCAVVAAVPAWEMESWWFLFPDAVGAVSESWRCPDQHVNRDVGKMHNAKEELARSIRPTGLPRTARFREYRESDAVDIARKIVEMGLIHQPRARSASWTSFVDQVREL